MTPIRWAILWTLAGGALLVVGERLLRHAMADGTIISRMLAPSGLADFGYLLLAVAFLALRVLAVGCLPGLLLARGIKIATDAWTSRPAPHRD